MIKKTIPIIIFLGILSLSLISLISAGYKDDYVYAGNGIVVYPTYILKQTCKAFMPCGVERIDIPHDYSYHNQYDYDYDYNNNYDTNQEGDGYRFYRELRSPGLSQVIRDQKSPTYNPDYYDYSYDYNYRYSDNYYSRDDYQQNYRIKYNQEKAPIVYVEDKNTKKHFANTYNTRNNYDSNGNWIGDDRNRDYQQENQYPQVEIAPIIYIYN